jgi:hypothetical protein
MLKKITIEEARLNFVLIHYLILIIAVFLQNIFVMLYSIFMIIYFTYIIARVVNNGRERIKQI